MAITLVGYVDRQLGSTSDRGAHLGHVELGDGVQEVVPGVQDPHLLRHSEGEENEENW